ncbi:MAG: septum formation initiator family protein [Candidatus Omnitrophica bacterium]|nr:septum formation initiator family protein [Candidatus Omnitrophota bacterium]
MRIKAWMIAGLTALVLALVLAPIYWRVVKLNRQKSGLETEVRQLQAMNQVLENKLRLLNEDPVYVEYIARRKFRKGKEGEVVYEIVSPEELENP